MDYYDDTELVETWKERKFRKFREKLNELGLKLPNYRTKNGNWLEDIGNAIEKMKNDNSMPLVMATSSMVRRAPMFRVKEKEKVDIAQVAYEMKELKTAKVWFMEQSRKQM